MTLWKALGALTVLLGAYGLIRWAANEAVKQELKEAEELYHTRTAGL